MYSFYPVEQDFLPRIFTEIGTEQHVHKCV